MPFTVGAITVGITWIAELILGAYMINTRGIDAYRATYLMTGVAFDGAVAMALAVVAAVFDRRRRISNPIPANTTS
jgi:hypothetical protein